MPSERLLTPQQRTFKLAMSALTPISSALPPEADEKLGSEKRLKLTQSGPLLSPIGVTAFDPDEMYLVLAAFHGI